MTEEVLAINRLVTMLKVLRSVVAREAVSEAKDRMKVKARLILTNNQKMAERCHSAKIQPWSLSSKTLTCFKDWALRAMVHWLPQSSILISKKSLTSR